MVSEGTLISFQVFPGPYRLFAPDAFGEQIGRGVEIMVDGKPLHSIMSKAVVSGDGTSAMLTVEVWNP